jgi:phosphoserine phosphatase
MEPISYYPPMKYKDFPSDFIKKIEIELKASRAKSDKIYAAFDADGTLWDTDLGESFFDYLIDNKKVPLPPDPWDHYLTEKKKDPKKAYLWLAQICKGQEVQTIRNWAADCVSQLKPPIFNPQAQLIQFLQKEGVEIYIVTASIKWAVEPGALLLGLNHDSVIGIETELESGLITDRQKGPITYRQGKVEAFLQKSNSVYPFFCSGNSEGDQELLMASRGIALAVSATRPDDPLYRTENNLLKLAKEKGWLTHRFVDDGQ